MTTHTLTKLAFLISLLCLPGAAAAGSEANIPESFRLSMESGCMEKVLKNAITDYGKMTGTNPEDISTELHAKLESVVQPLYASCACLARKVSAKVESASEKKMGISLDLSGLSKAAECATEPVTSSAVQRNFMRLIEAAPPATSPLKTKRIPFSVDITLNKGRPSLFAAYTRPPETLTKLVFLAPGTGMACGPRNVCIDKSPLEINKANELLASHSRILGKEGSQNLQKVMVQFGEDARVITSGNNFTNFVAGSTQGGFSYTIQSIDGVPIEKTTAKKLWLVFFASQVPADPRAIDFSPAVASVVEVEFLD
ncbi:MAG: hypothetical protein WA056_03015 [Gallionella sp.]